MTFYVVFLHHKILSRVQMDICDLCVSMMYYNYFMYHFVLINVSHAHKGHNVNMAEAGEPSLSPSLVVISDDEQPRDNIIIVLDEEVSRGCIKNQSMAFSRTDGRRKRVKRQGSDCAESDVIILSTIELIDKDTNITHKKLSMDNDYLVAVQLHEQLNPDLENDKKFAQMLQEQEVALSSHKVEPPFIIEQPTTSTLAKPTSIPVHLPNVLPKNNKVVTTSTSSRKRSKGKGKVSKRAHLDLPKCTECYKSSLSIPSYAATHHLHVAIQFMVSPSVNFVSTDSPSWWSSCDNLVDIPVVDEEAKTIVYPLQYSGFYVSKVERIQSLNLWRRYLGEVKLLAQSRGEQFQLNEQILYHCSRADKSVLCTEGLDARLSLSGSFGRGIYFRYGRS